jgi:Peptidase family M3
MKPRIKLVASPWRCEEGPCPLRLPPTPLTLSARCCDRRWLRAAEAKQLAGFDGEAMRPSLSLGMSFHHLPDDVSRCDESVRIHELRRGSEAMGVLYTWEYANAFFREFGHALHRLCNATPSPSLGSMHVASDFVELPALLNERWLADRELLARLERRSAISEWWPWQTPSTPNSACPPIRPFAVSGAAAPTPMRSCGVLGWTLVERGSTNLEG